MSQNHGGERTVKTMLICPDTGLAQALRPAASAAPQLVLAAAVSEYPAPGGVVGMLNGFDALALDVGSDRQAALALLKTVLEARPDIAVIALARTNDPETILQCLRMGAAEFLSSPFPPNDLRQAVHRIGRRQQTVDTQPAAAKRGRLLVFAPVKGGAGCTTLATNVAYAIKRQSQGRVLLADMHLSAGIVAFLLRLQTPYSVLDALRHSSQLDDALWKSLVVTHEGVDILAAPERPEPALIESFPAEEMFDFCRSAYDYVVLDLGSICEGLGLTAATAADSINLVCSTDMPSLFMMRRTIPLLEEMGRTRDQINVLVNRVERRSDLSTEDMEKIFRASVHATFPEDAQSVLRAQREGALVAESSELGKSVRRFARTMTGVKPKEAAGALGALRQLWGGA
jgi:pilus assembly protein CpaE